MILTEADLSIWTKRTPQQDAKSNNTAQHDEQHNAALRRRNHEKTQKKTLDMSGNHLFKLKEGEKMQRGDSRSKNDLKPLLLDKWKRKKTYREFEVSPTKTLGPKKEHNM